MMKSRIRLNDRETTVSWRSGDLSISHAHRKFLSAFLGRPDTKRATLERSEHRQVCNRHSLDNRGSDAALNDYPQTLEQMRVLGATRGAAVLRAFISVELVLHTPAPSAQMSDLRPQPLVLLGIAAAQKPLDFEGANYASA